MKSPSLLFFFLVSAAVVGTCGCIGQQPVLSFEEQMQVKAYADPIVDNLLEAFNHQNYTRYSQDFSNEMKHGLNESTFEETYTQIVSRIGLYVRRGEALVTQNGDFVTAIYRADFDQEQGVEIRLVFKKGDESHQIYGLWFNSPKLGS